MCRPFLSHRQLNVSQHVIATLKGRKNFIESFCLWHHSSQQGITCSKLVTYTHEKVWKLFNIKNANVNDIQYYHICIHNSKYISNSVLIIDFEQANLCSVHIEKKNIFDDKIGHIISYVLF